MQQPISAPPPAAAAKLAEESQANKKQAEEEARLREAESARIKAEAEAAEAEEALKRAQREAEEEDAALAKVESDALAEAEAELAAAEAAEVNSPSSPVRGCVALSPGACSAAPPCLDASLMPGYPVRPQSVTPAARAERTEKINALKEKAVRGACEAGAPSAVPPAGLVLRLAPRRVVVLQGRGTRKACRGVDVGRGAGGVRRQRAH